MFRQKVNIILVLATAILFSSCSVFKRTSREGRERNGEFTATTFLKEVREKNVSNQNFRIDRVRVVSEIEGGKHRFSGNLKYIKEGKLLFSARAIAGIEVARIYIDRTDIVVIDRINRVYYEGETNSYLLKYGLSWNDIVVIFGDIPFSLKSQGRVVCVDGTANINSNSGGKEINYSFNCVNHKLVNILIANDKGGIVEAGYTGFTEVDGAVFPGEVTVSDSNNEFGIELYYERYGLYEGSFGRPTVPKGYDIEKLL